MKKYVPDVNVPRKTVRIHELQYVKSKNEWIYKKSEVALVTNLGVIVWICVTKTSNVLVRCYARGRCHSPCKDLLGGTHPGTIPIWASLVDKVMQGSY